MSKHPRPDGSPAGQLLVGMPVGSGAGQEAEGGEPACWAHLVCPECGAITSEGHRPECALAPDTASKA